MEAIQPDLLGGPDVGLSLIRARERALAALERADREATRCCLNGHIAGMDRWERAHREAMRVFDGLPGLV
jgi:hypothetical protein